MEKAEFDALFTQAEKENGTEISAEAREKFYQLTELLCERNAVMNLTALTDPYEIITKHYLDAVSVIPYLEAERNRLGFDRITLCDVGTGAGFPSLPIAILLPWVEVTAVDSTAKKIGFVTEAAEKLALDNINPVVGRAEEIGQGELRESFDTVTARAVARLNLLAEWCMPLVKKNGMFLAMKGKQGMTELDEATNALNTLGGVLIGTDDKPLMVRGEEESRVMIAVRKRQFTPKIYPRTNAQMRKKPL